MNNKPTITDRIYNHLLGENHTPKHRKVTGLFIMMFGVTVIKIFYSIPIESFHFIGDVIGPLIHGIGCSPFLENIGKKPM